MYKLIRKELLWNWLNIAIFGGMIAAYAAYAPLRKLSPGFLMVSVGLLSAFTPVSFQAREDRFKGAALNCSLPASRSQIVFARYLTGWLLMIAGMILTFFVLLIVPGGRPMLLSFLSPKSLVLWAFFVSLVLSLFYPFTMRFGFMGVMILLVSLQLLGILLFFLGQISRAGTNPPRAFIIAVSGLVRSLKTGLGATGFLIFGVFLILMMNILSLFISSYLFARKDL